LLERISSVQKEFKKTNDFAIVRLVNNLEKKSLIEIDECKAVNLLENIKEGKIGIPGKPIVIGGTVWDWFKVIENRVSGWAGCDIMIIDEGSQVSEDYY